MGSVNVNRNVTDQFYRYKMPRLIAKVEGKGNGIKTVIANMVDIGKSLSRPPTYPTKFFGCELGAQTQFDSKNDRYIVNGSHDSSKLQDLLDVFIRKFVLCPECENPETQLLVLIKKQMISQKCIACGYLGNVDMRHKLTTFILKNPPGQEGATTPAGKKGKKAKKDEKTKTQNGNSEIIEQSNENSGVKQEKNADSDEHENNSNHFDEDDWAVDTDADAVKRRLEDLTDGAKGLMLNDDMEKTQQERIDIFYSYVKKRKSEGKIEIMGKEICGEAERLDIKDKATLVLSELIFDENMLQQVKTFRSLLLRFTNENSKAQKYLLGGFEQLVQLYRNALMPKVAHIMKCFYDNDILDEEIIIEWSKKISKKYVKKEVAQEIHEKVLPFIKWLQEAEEEDSSEDEDKEDVEVVYSDRNIVPLKSQTGVVTPKKSAVAAQVEEDDFDIDAI